MKALTNILWWICSWISIFIFLFLLSSFLDNSYLGIFLFIIWQEVTIIWFLEIRMQELKKQILSY